MKKSLLLLSLAVVSSAAFANLNGNGYYRVKNYGSNRWASLIDNTADIDKVGGNVDLYALQLNNNTEEILSDPASIVYISSVSNGMYDVAAQGVTLQSLVDNNIKIKSEGSANGQTLYYLYGTYSNAVKYIGDANILTGEQYGKASVNVANTNFKKWYIIPVDVNSDNYFGTVPTVKANDGNYTTLFTSFAYQPKSQNVKTYYINRVGYGMAEMVEINGAVPPGAPVVVKCAGQNVADNKLEIVGSASALPSNSLKGVYFNFSNSKNVNRVKYDAKTMRVLGTCSDGSLGFVVGNIDYIPANSTYLTVPAGSAPEIKCVSTEYYENNLPELPENLYFGENILQPQNDGTYSGSFEVPASEGTQNLKIRFYTSQSHDEDALGAYGSDLTLTVGTNQTFPFAYNSPYFWIIPNWDGGTLNITVDMVSQAVKFYSKSAGIETIIANDDSLIYDGSKIYSESASNITVFNLAGQKIASINGNSLDVTNLPKGIYTAVANGKSVKFVR